MAVTTTKTNKPLNPRGNDQSPLAFNRAKLYSGKALDFDGVNDSVDLDGFTMSGNTGTFTFNFYSETNNSFRYLFDAEGSGRFIIGLGNVAGEIQLYDGAFKSVFVPKQNTWINFVVSVNGTIASCYVNGKHEIDVTISPIDLSSTTNVAVGSRNDGTTSFWSGKIAGFKIFNTALTAAQVLDLYNNPEKIVPTGVADSALKLWLPMQEGAGTKCLDGASLHTATERVENGDFSNGTTGWVGNPDTTLVVTNGQLDIQSASAFTYYGAAFTEVNFTSGKYYLIQLDVISCDVPNHIRIGSTASAVGYAANIWGSGEIGIGSHSILWLAPSDYTYLSIGGRNDVTTLVIDNVSVKEVSVGNISGATWTHGIGSPVAQTSVIDWNKRILDKTNEFLIPQGLTAGRDLLGNQFENVRKQYALNLDGQSWAEVHKNDSIPEGDEGRTLECWFFGVDRTHTQSYMETGNNSGTNKRFAILTISSNVIYIAGQLYDVNTGILADLNAWNHVVVTHDGSTAKVYKNGSLIKTVTGRTYTTALDTVSIGRNLNNVIETSNGAIAQPRIYNRALTADEVEQNYNAGKNTYS